jgi:dienelactone hydrolase
MIVEPAPPSVVGPAGGGLTQRVVHLVSAASRETTLAQVGLALIAIHVVDDNFLQPQPGTAAGDHLVSGLVPVTGLLVFAAFYPGLRPGLRGGLALVLGVFGITIGVSEAVYYAVKVGASGDDFTGFLSIPAGLLLAGLGVRTLWRSRRRDDGLLRRYVRRLALGAGSVVVAYVVIFPFILSYAFTHLARTGVPIARLGAAHQDVAFRTNDGLTLRGWYVPSRNGAAVIVAPGRSGTQKHARMLARHGYGVLVFDRRGEGESGGDPNAFGWSANRDLKAALAFVERRPDVNRERIGGIGLSVGGETLLQAAAEAKGFRAVVSDGAGSRSIREDLARSDRDKWLELPTTAVITAGTALFSNQAPPPNLEQLVARIAPRSVLFIYAEHGQPNEINLTQKYYAAAGEPKALWQVPGAGHTHGLSVRPREYERRVLAFFNHALAGGS